MDILFLWLGWLLVWTFGIAVVAVLRATSSHGSGAGLVAMTAGCGWFAGQYLLTLMMRALALAGIPFGVGAIAAAVAGLALLLAWVAWRRFDGQLIDGTAAALRGLRGADLSKRRRVAWFAMLGWLGLRLALLLVEVLRRPMYPWDAWEQWATKARVWYALGTMAPFVSASEWLAPSGANVYFDAAPNYPSTVPLTQVWSAMLLGRWDDALVNLPWWLTALAFGIALYGIFRQLSLEATTALVATWLVLSLPILDTHVALAGYADLAMSTYLTLTALLCLLYVRSRDWGHLALAVLLASACIVIKNPGKLWILLLVPGVVAAWSRHYGLRMAAACVVLAAAVALVLTRSGVTLLGYHLKLDLDVPWNGLADAWFAYANWHLLFYGAIAVALIAWRQLLSREIAPLTVIVGMGMAFLMFGFSFTNASQWVEDQSTVNRATLHLAPLIVAWMVLTFRAWAIAQHGTGAGRHEAAAALGGA